MKNRPIGIMRGRAIRVTYNRSTVMEECRSIFNHSMDYDLEDFRVSQSVLFTHLVPGRLLGFIY